MAPIDGILTCKTVPVQSGSGSKGNEVLLHIPRLDHYALRLFNVIYQDTHSSGGGFTFQQKLQLAYFD